VRVVCHKCTPDHHTPNPSSQTSVKRLLMAYQPVDPSCRGTRIRCICQGHGGKSMVGLSQRLCCCLTERISVRLQGCPQEHSVEALSHRCGPLRVLDSRHPCPQSLHEPSSLQGRRPGLKCPVQIGHLLGPGSVATPFAWRRGPVHSLHLVAHFRLPPSRQRLHIVYRRTSQMIVSKQAYRARPAALIFALV
jgi:hypothetical protein